MWSNSSAEQPVTFFIGAPWTFFDGIMPLENSLDRGNNGSRWSEHEQSGQRAVIQMQSGGRGYRFTSIGNLRSAEQNLFLHTDVAEQSFPEFAVSGHVDDVRTVRGSSQRIIQTHVVITQVTLDLAVQ